MIPSPSIRCDSPAPKEGFYGEVDDVLAADAKYLPFRPTVREFMLRTPVTAG